MTIRSGKIKIDISELEQLVAQSTASDGINEKELQQCARPERGYASRKCRTIFILSREEKLSHKEIASQLNISANSRKPDDHRLKRLKSSLGTSCSSFSAKFFFMLLWG